MRVFEAFQARLPACFRLPADTFEQTLATTRLGLMEMCLKQAPTNDPLRVEAFEAAILAGDEPASRRHLQLGLAASSHAFAWHSREGEYWLARRDPHRAHAAWTRLGSLHPGDCGAQAMLGHHLAFIDLHNGRLATSIERLAAVVDPPERLPPADEHELLGLAPAAVRLWLLALGRQGAYARALAWCHAAALVGRLDGLLLGPASLMAMQAGDLSAADRWSRACLRHARQKDRPIEAMQVRARLGLAGSQARHWEGDGETCIEGAPDDAASGCAR